MGPFSSISDVGPTRRYRSSASSTRLSPANCFHSLHISHPFPSHILQHKFQKQGSEQTRINEASVFIYNHLHHAPFIIRMQRAKEKSVLSFSKSPRPAPKIDVLPDFLHLSSHGVANKVPTNVLVQRLCEKVLSEMGTLKMRST